MLYALTQEVLGDTGHTTLPSYDMWQLGCLVWWMCTGSHLFSDAPEQQQVVVSNSSSRAVHWMGVSRLGLILWSSIWQLWCATLGLSRWK